MARRHPIKISYEGSLEELAEEIGNLRYDILAEFLNMLSKKMHVDGKRDLERGRAKLSTSLFDAAKSLKEAGAHIERALEISKPFMKEEFGE